MRLTKAQRHAMNLELLQQRQREAAERLAKYEAQMA